MKKLTPEQIDRHLEQILKASGSRLANYEFYKTIEDMREAVREVELECYGNIAMLDIELNDKNAYLRTLANFGGTLEQAKELAQKALDKWSGEND